MKQICVFAASSDAAAPAFGAAAARLGQLLAESGLTLVYGAGKVGLMGEVARSVHAHGGRVIGVIPEKLHVDALTYRDCDELIVTETMSERKAIMTARADGFVVLPGGFGTLEELFEVLVGRQLGYHTKPIVFLNTGGAFDGLMAYFADMVTLDLVRADQCDLFSVATTPEGALEALRASNATPVAGKWAEPVTLRP
ncbi:MAG: TIGR00730 family Rossman fold protein [Candidatus Hydrogenedentes bacterium]|nr:TIGR00730 family Rossman fold protein [Candidatus Hydrogenedentota bacterium]